MGIDTLRIHRDLLKWWYKLASMTDDGRLKRLFSQEWNISLVEVDKGNLR